MLIFYSIYIFFLESECEMYLVADFDVIGSPPIIP